jgi:hypothetical protein
VTVPPPLSDACEDKAGAVSVGRPPIRFVIKLHPDDRGSFPSPPAGPWEGDILAGKAFYRVSKHMLVARILNRRTRGRMKAQSESIARDCVSVDGWRARRSMYKNFL